MSMTAHMIDDYQRERVEFRKILNGIQSERQRWSQCVEWTNKKLGMAVGALFIRDNFNQESKVLLILFAQYINSCVHVQFLLFISRKQL